MNNEMLQIMRLEAKIKGNNHILHVILSLLTGGLWVPVWILCCVRQGLINSDIRRQIRKLEKSV